MKPLLLLILLFTIFSTTSAANFVITSPPSSRQVLKWPFAAWSIWNLPIGNNASYEFGNIYLPNTATIEADPDIIVLNSSNPLTPIYYSSAAWTGASRCQPSSSTIITKVPYPSDFIVASDGSNYSGAFLMPDNVTIVQTQPICHCTNSTQTSNVTTLTKTISVSIYGDGAYGSHGGSGLSSIGGTLRLGELIPDSNGTVHPVRHALKGNLWAVYNYYRNGSAVSSCFRWPATGCDGYFADGKSDQYGGTNPYVRPGSLLALNTSININNLGLKTIPGLAIAWTLQNYGMYLADDSYWNAAALETEISPEGNYVTQFKKAWNMDFTSSTNAWAVDVRSLFRMLSVVNSWNKNMWLNVSSSNGTLGAGGGFPLQSWAPPFANDSNIATPVSSSFIQTSSNSPKNSTLANNQRSINACNLTTIILAIVLMILCIQW